METAHAKLVRPLIAGLGAAALVIVGVFGALAAHGADHSPMASTMQVGQTTTLDSTPPTAPGVVKAVPAIRGPAK